MASFRDPLLQAILSQPSSPFREMHVMRVIRDALSAEDVPHFRDPAGNLVIGAASVREYASLLRKTSKDGPLRLFIAHTDHPGFHGESWKSATELEIRWHGGSPTAELEGASVWLADSEDWLDSKGLSTLRDVKMIPSGRAVESAVVTLADSGALQRKHPDARKIFGGLAFRAPWWREDQLIYTKAADDLVGAFAIVSLALDLWSGKKRGRRSPPPFLGLLTRAEEVGFIGAIAHLELGWLAKARREILCVSLETSRTLPGAEIGKGPVVRLGDRYTTFDAGALRVFTDVATKKLPEKHQRRIMDGGTCEATAATVYGLPSIGISVPLGNYHNQSFEGGPDSRGPNGPAPEFVHLGDVAGLIELCHALLEPKLPWTEPFGTKRRELKKSLQKYRRLLSS